MKTTIRNRAVRGQLLLTNVVVIVMLFAGQMTAPPTVSAANNTVDVVGTITEVRSDTAGGCEKYTVLLFPDLAGDPYYTVAVHDTLGYSFVAGYPPFDYDGQYGFMPPLGPNQHRVPLTYQGGGVGGCQADDVSRYSIVSLVAGYGDISARIVGSVTDDHGAGLASIAVSISGPSSSTQQTNDAGAYGVSVAYGQYTVSAPAGYCVVGGATCTRSKSVDVQGPTGVNFVKSSGTGTIAGTVTERTCTQDSCTEAGLPGVTVSAAGPDGGNEVTGSDGKYSITVGAGDYVVTPTLDDREFDPQSLSVTVNDGDQQGADFATCAVPPASLTADQTAVACKTLHVDWTMPSHIFAAGWDHDQVSKDYVNPPNGWKVNLFLKDESGAAIACAPDSTWTWKIAPRGTDQSKTYADRSCRLSTTVAREGVYTVSVEERRKSDQHLVAKGEKDVTVQDFLIVGLGDSNGSGQGNPPYWNRQCDRSLQSYQMRAAQFVERHDPRTSVTFVHLACSGARTVHVADETYGGQEPNGTALLPQLVELRQRALRWGKPVREIDAMILSAGINDLRFGGIVAICLKENDLNVPCQQRFVKRVTDPHGEPTLTLASAFASDGMMKDVVGEELDQLPTRINTMASSMAKIVTIDPQRVLMTAYPDESWRAKGVLCDQTTGHRPRLTRPEWGWLSQAGARLNAAVAGGPFTAITSIPNLFIGHGYCTIGEKNWFRSVAGSFAGQWNEYGTFHATTQGHLVMSIEVLDVLCGQLFNGNSSCEGVAREPGTGSLP